MRRSTRLKNKQKQGKEKIAGGSKDVRKKATAVKKTVPVTVIRGEKRVRTNDNKWAELPSTSNAAAAKDDKIDTEKRPRLSADQRPILDADLILTPVSGNKHAPSINPLNMDRVIDRVFSFIFPGSESENFNLNDVCNFRLVCQTWNKTGVRLLRRHCRIGVGSSVEGGEASDTSGNSNAAEHDIEEELTLSILPITLNLPLKKIQQFASVMKNSHDIPFVMFSFREGLFSEENTRVVIELLQTCGPIMEQLLVTMEPSTCTISFLTQHFQLNKLKQLRLMMKPSKIDYTTSVQIYPIDGVNGMCFLQTLCDGAAALDRLDIHWMPTLMQWTSTFGLKDLCLPKTITKLTVDTINTDGITIKKLLLHNNISLTILKWSIGLPLQSLSADDVSMCLKRQSESLRTLHFSIWISRLHHDGNKLVEFPPMPNVEELSLMGDGNQITPFSFAEIFPKLSSLTLYHEMLDFMSEAKPSKTVKVVRILGTLTGCDVRNTLAKTFLELETLILFPQNYLLSKDYLVSMFDLMPKLRILLISVSGSDATSESNIARKEDNLPNGLYMRSCRRSTCIVRIESGSTEITRALSEASKHLDSVSRNQPFTFDAATFKYL